MASGLNSGLSQKTSVLGLKAWELMAMAVGLFIVIILVVLSICLTKRKKSKKINSSMLPFSHISSVPEEIKEIRVDQVSSNNHVKNDSFVSLTDKFSDKESTKALVQMKNVDNLDNSQSGSFNHLEKDGFGSQSGDESGSKTNSSYSPLSGLPEFSQLGWGHWFTLRDLELATNRFSRDNVIGEGGYGVVYRGQLINGNPVAVKKILNNVYVDKSFIQFCNLFISKFDVYIFNKFI